jgi:UDP-N-acetylmuramate dehydrogenase
MEDTKQGLAGSLVAEGFRGAVLSEEPLAPYTTWRIGGPAEILAHPSDRGDVVLAVRWAESRGIPWRILGNGSNILVREDGVRGLVLRLRKVLDSVSIRETRIVAEAGASLPSVANLAAANGLEGLEYAAGIPATVGGAVIMNAGWHEHELGNLVASVEFMERDGTIRRFPGRECGFGYRTSLFRSRPGAVLEAVLRLRRADPATIAARMEEFSSARKRNQPTELPSCGSVFLKPEGDYAGRLIDAAGLKETRIGDVQVSPKHANFFVNVGRATAQDVLALVEKVEEEVEARFGVRLEREFELW